MEPMANVANWSWQLLSWACISPQHYKQLLPTSQSWSRWPNIIPKFNYVKFELSQLSAHICMVGSQLSSCLAETKQSSTTWPFCFTVCVLLLGIVNEFPSVINLTHAYKCPFRSAQRTESPALNNRITCWFQISIHHRPPLVRHPLSECPVKPEIQLYIAFFLEDESGSIVITRSCLKILCWFPTVYL